MTNNPIEGIAGATSESSHSESQTGWRRYLGFSTDHKVIGIQYLVTSFIFFLIAGLLSMIIRGELITPKLDLVDRPVYNGLFTIHGTMMIFLWIIPTQVGLANYLIPLMIGARDMAFPVLNGIAFWIIPPAGILLLSSFLLPSGTAQAGWWSYPPVSIQNPSGHLINGELIWVLSVALLGISSIMGGGELCHNNCADAGAGNDVVPHADLRLDGAECPVAATVLPAFAHGCSGAAVLRPGSGDNFFQSV